MGLRRLCRTAALNVNVSLWDNLCNVGRRGSADIKGGFVLCIFGTVSKTFFPLKLIAYA